MPWRLTLMLALVCGVSIMARAEVALTVTDRAGVARVAAPVRGGVPFARGELPECTTARLVDADGADLPCAVRPIARWWDGSVKWLLVDTQVDLSASGQVALRLLPGETPPRERALTVSETDAAITVDTGPARFVFAKDRFGLPAAAWADRDGDGTAETQVVAAPGEFACEVEHEPPGEPNEEEWLRDAAGSGRERFVAAPEGDYRAEIESASDLRAVVKLSGWLVNDEGRRLLQYVIRAHASAGSPELRVAVSFGDARIELRVPVRPGQTLVIATNPPRRYSDMLAWIERQVEAHPGQVERQSLGRSAEGRDIPIVRECDCAADHQRLVVLAGQHPSEHSGNWACEGIVEWLLSPIREAREIGRQFDIAVIPMINPDGNVHGLSGANAEGINLYPDFTGAANGEAPKATENRLLWRWLSEEFQPEVLLHFHGYMGWRRFSTPPGDGMYLLRDAERVYSPERLAAYRAIGARFTFETPALTASWRPGVLGEESLEHNLALRLGTLSAFYEINSAWVGAFEQFRRGPQVLAALARALMLDAPVDV